MSYAPRWRHQYQRLADVFQQRADQLPRPSSHEGHERFVRDGRCYVCVGTYDAARPWVTNRVGDLESRLETVHAVSMTLTNATDGRTTEGRKVRKIERTIGRLIEDLAEMAEVSS